MEILSDATFKGEVNFNKNATFVNGTVLDFRCGGSFDGASLVATEFVYPRNQGKLRMVDENTGQTVADFYFPNSSTEFFRSVGKPNRLLISNHLCQIIEEYDSILMANTTLPANCTRFFFTHLKNTVSRNVPLSSNSFYPFTIPSIQVWRSPQAKPRIVQMEVEMTRTGDDYNFIGNIADHQDEIDASEFILVVKK